MKWYVKIETKPVVIIALNVIRKNWCEKLTKRYCRTPIAKKWQKVNRIRARSPINGIGVLERDVAQAQDPFIDAGVYSGR